MPAGASIEQRQMDGSAVAPQTEQVGAALAPSSRAIAPMPPRRRRTRGQGRCAVIRCAFRKLGETIASSPSSQQPGDGLEPGDHRPRQIDAGDQHQRQMREQRHVGRLDLARLGRSARRTPPPEPQHQRAERDQQSEHQQHGEPAAARAKVELTIRNSLMNTPSGGRPAIATTPSTSPSRAPDG